MDAVISGRSGTALLIDGDIWLSFSVDDPDSFVYRSPADLRFLFGDAIDLLPLHNTNRESVIRTLRLERSISSSLDLVLILLDRDLSEGVREKAATALENLIADGRVHARLEGTLYGHPLPRVADLHGALKYCHRTQAGLTRSLLQRLKERQSLIKDVRLAWDSIPSDVFESEDQRAEFHHVAITEGLFRDLVTADVNTFLKVCESNANVNSLLGSQGILRQWVSRLTRAGIARPIPRKARAKTHKIKPPASRIPDRDVVIIGGGVAGGLSTTLTAKYGVKKVVVSDKLSADVHGLERIRNHVLLGAGLLPLIVEASVLTLLQSGLHYEKILPLISPRGASRYLSHDLGTPLLGEEQGRESAFERYFDELVDSTKQFRFNDKIKRLLMTLPSSHDVSTQLLDVSSSTSNIMRIARVHTVRFEQPNMRLLPVPSSGTDFLVCAESESIEPRFTILSAGMGQGELLNQLGLIQSSIWQVEEVGACHLLIPYESVALMDERKFLHDSEAVIAIPGSIRWQDLLINFVDKVLGISYEALNYMRSPEYRFAAPFRSYLRGHEHEDLANVLSYSSDSRQWATSPLTNVWSSRYRDLIAVRSGAANLAFHTANEIASNLVFYKPNQIFDEIRLSKHYLQSSLHREPFYARFVGHEYRKGEYERVRNLYERAKKRNARREQKR